MGKLWQLVSVLLVGLLCACQSESRKPNPIEITLSGWQSNPNESKLLGQVIAAFEAEHPTIKVKREVINSQFMDVLQTRLIGDVGPDVFYLEALEAPRLMDRGVLEPLDGYIQPQYQLTDFEPKLLDAFRHQGRLYGIPKDFSTLALFYNRDALAKANLTQPPQTWAALLQAAKQLTIDQAGQSVNPKPGQCHSDRRIAQYGLGIAPELPRQAFMLTAFGGQIVDSEQRAAFASPAGVKGLQQVVEPYQRECSMAQPADVGASSNSEAFGQGRVAMAIEGAWAIPYLKDTFPNLKFATAEVPTIGDRKGTMAFTVAYVINRKSKHKAAAWTLIEYLTNQKGMRAWATQGVALPARRSVMTALKYDRDPLYAPLVAGAAYATPWRFGETLPTIATHFDNQFVSALLGQTTLKQALRRAQEQANRQIELSK